VAIINLTSDSKDEFGLHNPSPLSELKNVRSEPTPKRLKHERSKSVMLLASGMSLPDSPESSTKTSKDKSRRHKGHPYYKFTEHYLSKHIDNKSRWFKAISKRYNNLTKLLT
jgi:hypothetical protein